MNPRFPIYIPSRGRADSRLTVKALEKMGVSYRVIVEGWEYETYARVIEKKKLLVLDPAYLRNFDAMVPVKPGEPLGPAPVRNFAWDHAISLGAEWHWTIDDNVRGFFRLNNNLKTPVGDGTVFRCMEDFCLRYENVAMAGPNYYMFAPRKQPGIKPFTLNTRIYSCQLTRSDLPFRWRAKYNDDTDISLRLLKAGWCTVLFNAFLQEKMTASPGVRMKGGSTEEVYKGGSQLGWLEKSMAIVDAHPDVARVVQRFGRFHHYVDYTPFKANKLLLKKGVKVRRGSNDYGMRLLANPDWTGRAPQHSKHGRVLGDGAPE